jgi:transposase
MAIELRRTSELLAPLVARLREHVMAAEKLPADDTPVPVLAPGNGKTKTGRVWTYVRDDRPAGEESPPAVWFAYSEDRKGEHPRQHLKDFAAAESQGKPGSAFEIRTCPGRRMTQQARGPFCKLPQF